MTGAPDTNPEVWHSEEFVQQWIGHTGRRTSSHEQAFRLLGELLPFDRDAAFTFADLGAGTGAAARAILAQYPASSAILADYSRPMMAAGETAMRPFTGRFHYVEFDMSANLWPTEIPPALNAIVTSMCVHHLPDRRKRDLFSEIYDHLAPGGWYLNYDAVATTDPVVRSAWERADERTNPRDTDAQIPPTELETAGHEDHVRNLAPLDTQLDFLRSAAFEGTDVYWKRLEAVIYGGRRPL